MNRKDIEKYYSRRDIQEEIYRFAQNRELAVKYKAEFYGKRPLILSFPSEIGEYARQGVTSFHVSLERWSNPLLLEKQAKLDDIRIGWDLIFDLDCKYVEYSKIAAKLIKKLFKIFGIRHYWIKFSGGSGFHIILPYETFPEMYGDKNIVLSYPEAAREVVEFIKNSIRDDLKKELLKFEDGSVDKIARNIGKNLSKDFDPFEVVEIDSMVISPRHLIRAPYSLNEKKWLASVPVPGNKVEEFDIESAKPENIEIYEDFFRIDKIKSKEAALLFFAVYDWYRTKISAEFTEKILKIIKPSFLKKKNIKEEDFPPCIKNILKGLEDGRKRALFVLLSFLLRIGWDWEVVEAYIKEWNKRNKPPLKDSYIRSQLKWYKKLKEPYMVPNCQNKTYIQELGICKPDKFCREWNIKNPLVYVIKKKIKWKK